MFEFAGMWYWIQIGFSIPTNFNSLFSTEFCPLLVETFSEIAQHILELKKNIQKKTFRSYQV